ncbi:MAG: hypothetical protein M1835_001200, partial [Candelina submexicana]
MLDSFEILTTSGVVLWSKTYVPVSANIINSLIAHVFIEERVVPGASAADDISAARNPPHRKDQYTLKWTTAKDLGLIFVAVYQSLLHLSWIDKLLDNVKTIFVDLFRDQLKKPHTSVVECHFDEYFDQQMRELENSPGGATKPLQPTTTTVEHTPPSSSGTGDDEPPPIPGLLRAQPKLSSSNATSTDATPIPTPDTSRPASPAINQLLPATKGPAGRTSRRAKKAASTSANASSGDESRNRKLKATKPAPKKGRRWGADGLADEDDEVPLDYSAPANGVAAEEVDDGSRLGTVEAVSQESWGTKTGKGEFVLKDLDEEVHSILSTTDAKKVKSSTSPGLVGSSLGAIGGLFRNIVGGKILTKEDLDKAMKGMEEHLLRKNVAREAAVRLCEGVERELLGVKTGSFETVEAIIRSAMESSLLKILTPTTSLDLLRNIQSVTHPPTLSSTRARPYVISIVGVNGVGKSTNLSKIAFFLLQNKYRILIAACDTFRSGAVEQLRVHARNLKELSEREGGEIELYEKGYGKDAANIAKDAVS